MRLGIGELFIIVLLLFLFFGNFSAVKKLSLNLVKKIKDKLK